MNADEPAAHIDDVLSLFRLDGERLEVVPHRRGHIHDTFVSTWRTPAGNTRFLHQRMNENVFHDIPALMRNVERVTRHLESRADEGGLHTLRLVRGRDGAPFVRGSWGAWRTYHFIERTESVDRCRDGRQAFEAARAFGGFQAALADLAADELEETIPAFFDVPNRLRQLEESIAADAAGRADGAGPEIDAALRRAGDAGVMEAHLAAGAFPRRVVHGDTKLNNVLFDMDTARAVCVVDLDTCMPAWSLYDFGDLVRFTAATSAEDERDLDRAGVDLNLYRALVDGYLEGAGGFLTPLERELMPFSARLVTWTIGVRFLADHLAGDVYFKVAREGQNLDRARVQLRMVERMEAAACEMEAD